MDQLVIQPEIEGKNMDEIAKFMNRNASKIKEALYLSMKMTPSVVSSSLKYRMHAPDYFNFALRKKFSPETLKITEHEGLSHDAEIYGKRVSIKSTKSEIFSRKRKRGEGRTKATKIQLVNTKNSKNFNNNAFDYLWVICINEKSIVGSGIYLLSMKQVQNLIPLHDGIGQIQIQMPNKEDCLAYLEISEQDLQKMKPQYHAVSAEEQNARFIECQEGCIEQQYRMLMGEEL
jgi:hypothetical protein